MSDSDERQTHFILLGVEPDTANMGVSALLVSTVKCILHSYPSASVSLLEGSRRPRNYTLVLGDGREVHLDSVGVRRNKMLWHRNHVVRLLCTAILLQLVPIVSWRSRLLRRNPILYAIASAHCVADITAGDSFSDIYGLKRLAVSVLYKALAILAGADLVLLPQTYGPFKGRLARALARWVISRSATVYSRDREGLQALRDLMGSRPMRSQPRFSYDMAFILDAIPPEAAGFLPRPLPPKGTVTLIGVNVSGLLYNGGYTRNNMFGLSSDYPALILSLTRELLSRERTAVLLVPHVFKPAGHPESDLEACRKVFDLLIKDYAGRVFLVQGEYDQSQIKYIIGQCDFFIGSRMHACIAAVSQGIPTVPLAYSRKFQGVFDTVGIGDTVIDLRVADTNSAIRQTLKLLDQRERLAQHLEGKIPQVQQNIISLLSSEASLPAEARNAQSHQLEHTSDNVGPT